MQLAVEAAAAASTLTKTRFSVLSPFVSNLTIYLTKIFVWRPSMDLTLSAKHKQAEGKDEDDDRRESKIVRLNCSNYNDNRLH